MGSAAVNQGFELAIEDEVLSNCIGDGYYRHNGNLVHGDQVLITKADGSTQEAWVDLEIPNNAKDPYFQKEEDCVYWEATLNYHISDGETTSQGEYFCNENEESNFPTTKLYASLLDILDVTVYLPRTDIYNFMISPEPASGLDATQENHQSEFCTQFGKYNNDNNSTVFGLSRTYTNGDQQYRPDYGFYSTDINNGVLNIKNDFNLLDPILATYSGNLSSSSSSHGVLLRFDLSEVESKPKLKAALFNDPLNKPFQISMPLLIKVNAITANGSPPQIPHTTEELYFVLNYKKGLESEVVSSTGNYTVHNPTINDVAVSNAYENTPPCPNTYRLVDRFDAYIDDLVEGDQLKVIRSGNRNILAASEGLVVANADPILKDGNNKFIGIRPSGEIKITQVSSQEFSDDYSISKNYSSTTSSSYNKFLQKSDGKFKVTKTKHYNASRYQNANGVETAEDGYMQSTPTLWSSTAEDCFFSVKSPIQDEHDSWLPTEEILTFSESGSSSEAKNSLDIYSSVLLNPLGNVEAVVSNAKRSEVGVESFENYKHLNTQRYWNNHLDLLAYKPITAFFQVGNQPYSELELTDDHEELLIRGVAHTGDYSIFLKGDNPNSLNNFYYSEVPLNSMVNQMLGTTPSTNTIALDISAYPNGPINLSALETSLQNSYPTEVASEISTATGTNGSNQLTYTHYHNPIFSGQGWNPDAGTYRLSVWVKDILPNDIPYRGTSPSVSVLGTQNFDIISQNPVIEKEIDGWYQISLDFTYLGNGDFTITLDGGLWGAFFDDLRIHKSESNMQTYVYDMFSGRLKAQLDENNYATFYDYDEAGILSQIRRETSAGVLTVSESRQSLRNR